MKRALNPDSPEITLFKETLDFILEIDESDFQIYEIIKKNSLDVHAFIQIIATVAFCRPKKIQILIEILIRLKEKKIYEDIFSTIEEDMHGILCTQAHILIVELARQHLINCPPDDTISKFFREPVDILKYKLSNAIMKDDLEQLIELTREIKEIEFYTIRSLEYGGIFEFDNCSVLDYAIFYSSQQIIEYLINLDIFHSSASIDFAIAGGNTNYIQQTCSVIPYKKKHYFYAILYHQRVLVEDIEDKMDETTDFFVSEEEIFDFKINNFYFGNYDNKKFLTEMAKVISKLNLDYDFEYSDSESDNYEDNDYTENLNTKLQKPARLKTKSIKDKSSHVIVNSRLSMINRFVEVEMRTPDRLIMSNHSPEVSENYSSRLDVDISQSNEIEREILGNTHKETVLNPLHNPNASTYSTFNLNFNEYQNPESLENKCFPDLISLESAVAYAFRLFQGQLMIKKSLSDENTLVKICKCNNCVAVVSARHVNGSWIVERSVKHSCSPFGYGTPNQIIDPIIRSEAHQKQLGKPYFEKIKSLAKDACIPDQRIRRRYNYIFKESSSMRINSWKSLPQLVNEVNRSGGSASILYEKDSSKIKFVGMSPSYAKRYLNSEACFPVLISDGAFLYGQARGDLVAIVSLSGNRSVIPIAWGWGEGETEFVCTNLFKLIDHHRIETFLSDAGTALNSATKKLGNVFLQICAYHIAASLLTRQRNIFWKLIKARSKKDFNITKHTIISEYPELHSRLSDKYSLLSIYEDDDYHVGKTIPRHNLKNSGPIECFNNMIKQYRDEEPFELFNRIYHIGLNAIHELLDGIKGKSITNYASKQIKKELEFLDEVTLTDFNGIFVSVSDESLMNKYMINKETMCCTCLKREDCGLPCRHLLKYCFQFNSGSFSSLIDKSYRTEFINEAFDNYMFPYLDFDAMIPLDDAGPPQVYSRSAPKNRRKMNIDYMKESRFKR